MTRRSLLPPSATALERAFETISAGELIPAADQLWNAAHCPEHVLPWLAWSVGVESWSAAWSADEKRRVIGAQMAISRQRGTVWSVREALRAIGYAEATLTEGLPPQSRDATLLRSGTSRRDGSARWAMFKVNVALSDTTGVNAIETARMLSVIEQAKPERSLLYAVEYGATVADAFSIDDEALSIAAELELSDIAHSGPHRNARRARNGSAQRVAPRDSLSLSADLALSDHSRSAPRRDGYLERAGVMARDGLGPLAIDRMDLVITRRQTRNARILRNASARHEHLRIRTFNA